MVLAQLPGDVGPNRSVGRPDELAVNAFVQAGDVLEDGGLRLGFALAFTHARFPSLTGASRASPRLHPLVNSARRHPPPNSRRLTSWLRPSLTTESVTRRCAPRPQRAQLVPEPISRSPQLPNRHGGCSLGFS